MAHTSRLRYEWIAHIQINTDGTVREVAGVSEGDSMREIYLMLLDMATKCGGWLLSEQIKPIEVEEPNDSRCTYNEKKEEPPPSKEDDVSSPTHKIGDKFLWEEYEVRYSGASRYTGRS